jgi:hypothetical protein
MGFDHARMWTLADKCNGENPQWVAQLDVIAPVFEILPRFQVDNPSSENLPGHKKIRTHKVSTPNSAVQNTAKYS